jgi:predicted HAD superfamily Cof-like phosphohydrolase
MQELSEARAAADIHGIIDAYADMIVVITGSIYKLGYDPNKVLAETLLEISSRKGTIDLTTGKWQKDINQDPTTLYKADYSACIY